MKNGFKPRSFVGLGEHYFSYLLFVNDSPFVENRLAPPPEQQVGNLFVGSKDFTGQLIGRYRFPSVLGKDFQNGGFPASNTPVSPMTDFPGKGCMKLILPIPPVQASLEINISTRTIVLPVGKTTLLYSFSLAGRVSKWLKDADCKSARFVRSSVRIRPLPPFFPR